MKPAILKYRNHFIILLQFLFWILSLNAWNIVYNPAVESINPVKGLNDEWGWFILLISLYCLYSFLPFIWLFKKVRLIIKILFSAVFITILLLIIVDGLFDLSEEGLFSDILYYFYHNFLYILVFHIPIAAAVYINIMYFIPKFLNKNKFRIYLLFLLMLTVTAAAANFVVFDLVIDKLFPSLFYITYFRFWEYLLIILSYLLFTSVVFLIWQYINMLQKIKEQTQNELIALKAQINPHFLFNNLNTIYSLALKNDKRTKDVVLQLSDFLRYVLYDTTNKVISLKKEVEIIETYVKLQQERVNPEITTITLHAEGDLEQADISPLLLLPIAENCFKHGIGKNKGKINIFINYNGKHLQYVTENTIARRNLKAEKNNGGMGLENIKKQLNLLYPGKHSFTAEEKEGTFKVELVIELQKRNHMVTI